MSSSRDRNILDWANHLGILDQSEVLRLDKALSSSGKPLPDLLVEEAGLSRNEAADLVERWRLSQPEESLVLPTNGSEPPRTEVYFDRQDTESRSMSGLPTRDLGMADVLATQRSGFPRDWSRYEYLGFLGEGGMGQVFLAVDPKLRRRVALKFVRGDSPDASRRFMQEARAQARVDHENMCKVYEVGQVDGRAYIAMQYVNGEGLEKATMSMTLEQKLLVMIKVCGAIHEAHRLGLVHRDIKPSNIMIEATATGEDKAYVMDFGLAREQASDGATKTGMVIGTPNYMPPEQARGDIHELDRRSDVYSLGATLYQLLTGKPPFSGQSSVDILFQVLHKDPKRPREYNSSVPGELETIVLKCLEKEPGQRYNSARALGEDLRRYIDGEPIMAKRAHFTYRLGKKIRKNKAVSTVIAVASLVVLSVLAWSVAERVRSAKQARLNRYFRQEARVLDGLARFTYLIPLHDVRAQRDVIRERLKVIEERIASEGKLAIGPGLDVLGQGKLALDEYEAAKEYLERSWRAGHREPSTALALAKVYTEYYQRLRQENGELTARQKLDPSRVAEYEARLGDADRLYRVPAVNFLRDAGQMDSESQTYAEAMLAYHEKRYDEALVLCRQAYNNWPWLYEARQLEAGIHIARAAESEQAGSYGQAASFLAKAEAALEDAVAVGQSDPDSYLMQADMYLQRIRIVINGSGGDVLPLYEDGMQACRNALAADPERVEAYRLQSDLNKRVAESLVRQEGADVRPYLQLAVNAANRALHFDPDDGRAFTSLGAAHYELARDFDRRGEDPGNQLEMAVNAYHKALRLEASYRDYNLLGQVLAYQGRYLRDRGENPSAKWQEAAAAYDRAIALNARLSGVHSNAGNLYLAMSRYASNTGEDPIPFLQRARDSYEFALERYPQSFAAKFNLGVALVDEGRFLNLRGGDPRVLYARGLQAYRQAKAIRPENVRVDRAIGTTFLSESTYLLEMGVSPLETLDRAESAYTVALESRPNSIWARRGLANVYRNRARALYALGQPSAATFDETIARYRAILRDYPDNWDTLSGLIETLGWYAWELNSQRQDPRSKIDQATDALESMFRQNDRDYSPYLLRGRLAYQRGIFASRAEESAGAYFQRAKADLIHAEALNPGYGETLLDMGICGFYEAGWQIQTNQPANDALQFSATHLDHLVEQGEHQIQAKAWRLALSILQAKAGNQPVQPHIQRLKSYLDDNPMQSVNFVQIINTHRTN